MATNKHAQIRYKVLDECFSNFGRKFYFDDLIEKCNEALAEFYGDELGGVKTRTLRSDISYMRERAGEYDDHGGPVRSGSLRRQPAHQPGRNQIKKNPVEQSTGFLFAIISGPPACAPALPRRPAIFCGRTATKTAPNGP